MYSSFGFVQPPSSVEYNRLPFTAYTSSHGDPRYQRNDGTQSHDLSLFTRILEREYNRRSLLKPLLWENSFKLPLENVYTRLSIVSRRKTDFHLESIEVNMYDIFKTLSKGEDAIVLVEGSPGIGKTTFCLKISHDWANKKIPNESSFPIFELLLLLKCRDIHGDIMEAIIDQLLPDDMDEKAKEKIIVYIKDIHHQERILIILDGLDELPKTAESHVDKLLDRRILPFCYVLATSRQEKGITVRQEIEFDVLLQIKGFTEEDSFEYIKKHFSHLGPDHVPKGERLILAIQENTFLHALPSNPLNLLLLCVIFEDYHGDLPSFRTELYQIIICCLLRRYCAKHDLEAPADNKELEEKFEDSLLVLGELAWRCLLEDRFSFREEELARFERAIKNLAARKLGLVFKEASARKINPQHEYHFFHKTFQEYLAALYLAHKLLKKELTLDDFDFYHDIIERYQQVFIFVSGILGGDACVLFEQIGKKLQREDWIWRLKCSVREATFFIECLSESRNAEQVATTLLSFIPFPPSVTVDLEDKPSKTVLTVVNACNDFSQLRLPVHLTVVHMHVMVDDTVADFLRSYPRLQTLFFSSFSVTEEVTALLCDALRVNPTLYSFTLKTIVPISSVQAVAIGDSLAANKTLKTVTFKLLGVVGEDWATALETGLSADTPLTSIVLESYGPMSETEIGAFKRILMNKSLTSLVLALYEDIQDSLATTVREGLAAHSTLKSLTLTVYGNLSCSGATLLKNGFLGNSSLNLLELKVFGELPDNWVNICETVCSAKKSSMSFTVYPNVIGKIKGAQVACLCPVLEEKLLNVKLHSLTLNIWGELNCSGTDGLCKLLIASDISCVSLNINGRVTNSTANCLRNYFNQWNTLSALSIKIWGQLTRDGNSALQALSHNQTYSFTLTANDLNSDEKICKEVINFSVDELSSLTSAFTGVEDTCSSNLNLIIRYCSNLNEELRRSLVDGFKRSTSLTTLSLTLDNYSHMSEDLALHLEEGLAENTSLTLLSITLNNYSDVSRDWILGLKEGLAKNTSLTTLSITLNNYSHVSGDWTLGLEEGLAKNTSLTTLSITLNNYIHASGDWTLGLEEGLAKNTSLTTLTITLNNYTGVSVDWILGVKEGLAKNTSLTTLSITFDKYSDVSGDWTLSLKEVLGKNTSLTTLSITFNKYSDVSGGWILGVEEGLAENTSLTTLSLTLNNYSDVSGDWILGLENGLAKNTSLTTLSLTLNNCSDMMGGWILGLGEGLAKNTSLATLNLRLKECNQLYEDWVHRLRDSLEKNTSLTTISLEVDVFSERNGNSESGRV